MTQRDPAGPAPLQRGLQLFSAILRDGASRVLREQARELDIPLSTAYRLVAALCRDGLVARAGRGFYGPGLELAELLRRVDRRAILAAATRPHLRRLARRLRLTAHLGVLEDEMVTYLLKEQGGGPPVFTQVGCQLEAYCSAIGKVLLAHLPAAERDRYVGAGPFVALTPRTITDPTLLHRELTAVAEAGYAVDDEEVTEQLRCIAVPLHDRRHRVVAAISASRIEAGGGRTADAMVLDAVRDCVERIERQL